MYTVYAIKSLIKKYIYVGMTSNLQNRLSRHSNGREQTTRSYRPFKLVYTKEFKTRVEARKYEKYLKSGIGKEFLKSL